MIGKPAGVVQRAMFGARDFAPLRTIEGRESGVAVEIVTSWTESRVVGTRVKNPSVDLL